MWPVRNKTIIGLKYSNYNTGELHIGWLEIRL